jgi:hypothetical protein
LSADARGTLTWRARSFENRKILKINARVDFGAEISEANADQGVVYAVFPDGSACELERDIRGSGVRYRLELRESGGVVEEKRGTCAPSIVPSISGGPVDIVHDDDDDPNTTNTKLLTGNF